MSSYSRLRALVLEDTRFLGFVNSAINRIVMRGSFAPEVMADLCDELTEHYNLAGHTDYDVVVLRSASSRSRRPACITISRDIRQKPSPSALVVRRTGAALVQVFEADADDTDELAGGGEEARHWTKTEDRVLFV